MKFRRDKRAIDRNLIRNKKFLQEVGKYNTSNPKTLQDWNRNTNKKGELIRKVYINGKPLQTLIKQFYSAKPFKKNEKVQIKNQEDLRQFMETYLLDKMDDSATHKKAVSVAMLSYMHQGGLLYPTASAVGILMSNLPGAMENPLIQSQQDNISSVNIETTRKGINVTEAYEMSHVSILDSKSNKKKLSNTEAPDKPVATFKTTIHLDLTGSPDKPVVTCPPTAAAITIENQELAAILAEKSEAYAPKPPNVSAPLEKTLLILLSKETTTYTDVVKSIKDSIAIKAEGEPLSILAEQAYVSEVIESLEKNPEIKPKLDSLPKVKSKFNIDEISDSIFRDTKSDHQTEDMAVPGSDKVKEKANRLLDDIFDDANLKTNSTTDEVSKNTSDNLPENGCEQLRASLSDFLKKQESRYQEKITRPINFISEKNLQIKLKKIKDYIIKNTAISGNLSTLKNLIKRISNDHWLHNIRSKENKWADKLNIPVKTTFSRHLKKFEKSFDKQLENLQQEHKSQKLQDAASQIIQSDKPLDAIDTATQELSALASQDDIIKAVTQKCLDSTSGQDQIKNIRTKIPEDTDKPLALKLNKALDSADIYLDLEKGMGLN